MLNAPAAGTEDVCNDSLNLSVTEFPQNAELLKLGGVVSAGVVVPDEGVLPPLQPVNKTAEMANTKNFFVINLTAAAPIIHKSLDRILAVNDEKLMTDVDVEVINSLFGQEIWVP